MPSAPRAYLLDRFQSDAAALRQRAAAITPGTLRGAAPVPGPDAVTSSRMASACDDVVAMLEAIPDSDDHVATLASIVALVPLLEQRGAREAATPAVRAVYAGAATRIREIHEAETRPLNDGLVS